MLLPEKRVLQIFGGEETINAYKIDWQIKESIVCQVLILVGPITEVAYGIETVSVKKWWKQLQRNKHF